jgi:hypothetical protein
MGGVNYSYTSQDLIYKNIYKNRNFVMYNPISINISHVNNMGVELVKYACKLVTPLKPKLIKFSSMRM